VSLAFLLATLVFLLLPLFKLAYRSLRPKTTPPQPHT
jgi:hypothetical protein